MKAIIIGGGIGGLTTAVALKKYKFDYEVFEAADEIKPVGAGIWVPPNAMNVFERLGIADEIMKSGRLMDEISIGGQDGKAWQTIFAKDVIKEFKYGTITIHRGKLQQILFKYADPSKVHTRKRFVRLEQGVNKVIAFFEDGTSTEGDILIGADGLHSKVRQSIFGQCDLRYSGQTSWRGVTDYLLQESERNKMCERWGNKPGLRFAFSQMDGSSVYFYGTVCAPSGQSDNKLNLKKDLIDLFSPFGKQIQDLLENSNAEKILRTDIFDLKPMKEWYKGNVLLIGDAAHATTPNLGQGGAQAIEDAYAFAKTLYNTTDPHSAFEKFVQLRKEKANFIVNTSWSYGKMGNISNPILISIRNFIMAHAPASAGKKQLKKVYSLNF